MPKHPSFFYTNISIGNINSPLLEIHINDVVIDNNEMTCEQIDTTYVGIVIVGLIMLAFPICGEIAYMKAKYKIYKKAEKKRIKKAKRNEK